MNHEGVHLAVIDIIVGKEVQERVLFLVRLPVSSGECCYLRIHGDRRVDLFSGIQESLRLIIDSLTYF